jgi:hypothetical protein
VADRGIDSGIPATVYEIPLSLRSLSGASARPGKPLTGKGRNRAKGFAGIQSQLNANCPLNTGLAAQSPVFLSQAQLADSGKLVRHGPPLLVIIQPDIGF